MRLGIRVLALDNIYEAAGAATAELSAEVAARRRRLCDGMTTCACTYACDSHDLQFSSFYYHPLLCLQLAV